MEGVADLAEVETRDDVLVLQACEAERSGSSGNDSPVAVTVDTVGEEDEAVVGGIKRAGFPFLFELTAMVLFVALEAELNDWGAFGRSFGRVPGGCGKLARNGDGGRRFAIVREVSSWVYSFFFLPTRDARCDGLH